VIVVATVIINGVKKKIILLWLYSKKKKKGKDYLFIFPFMIIDIITNDKLYIMIGVTKINWSNDIWYIYIYIYIVLIIEKKKNGMILMVMKDNVSQ